MFTNQNENEVDSISAMDVLKSLLMSDGISKLDLMALMCVRLD